MKQATELLIERHLIQNYQRFYRLAFSYLKNEADALDAVQEGAYKAILNSGKLRNPAYLDTWLYRIMINESISILHRRGRENIDEEAALAALAVQDRYEDVDLLRALDKLELEDRTIVTLRYFEDLKLSQIAEITAHPLSTVKSRLYRAIDKLKRILTEQEM